MTSGNGLNLEKVRITFGETEIISIDANVAPGEVLTLMGPSGSGKSTLVNAIAGFLPREFSCAGMISLGGRDITHLPPEHRHVGVLFQDALLFPHLSVIENVIYALPPDIRGDARKSEAQDLLGAVGLAEFGARDPDTLSGGQKARVALIRVLAARPNALLLDEPFAKLDAGLRDAVRRLVFDEIAARQLPALLVTHDKADAEAAAGPMVSL